jgi:DNA-binding winged helix-turn-helix (wHTH) protein/Tol biopolymer transport system component
MNVNSAPAVSDVKICENDNSRMENEIYEFGSFRISALTRKLCRNGVEIPLTGREFDTLWALVHHPGVPLSWDVLAQEIWKDTSVAENNLRKQISSLRRKLGPDVDGNDYILTVPNQGYQLTLKVVAGAEREEGHSPLSGPSQLLARERTAPEPVGIVLLSPTQVAAKPRFRILGPLPLATAVLAVVCIGLEAWQLLPEEMQVLVCRQITRDGRQKHGGVFTDGNQVYFNEFVDGKSVIASVPLVGGTVTYLPIMPAEVLAITHARKALLVQADAKQLYEVQLGSFAAQHIPLPPGVIGGYATWDTTGHRIAVSSPDSVAVFEPGRATPLFQSHFAGTPDVSSWDPRGRRFRFAVLDIKSEVSRWYELSADGATARPLQHISPNPTERNGVWTSDGRFFVFEAGGLSQTQIWVEDLQGRAQRSYQLTNDARTWRNPTVVPGTYTILASAGQAQAHLVTLPLLGHEETSKAVLAGVPAYELDYSRDGKWITYTLFPEHTIWRCRLDGTDHRQVSPPGLEAHQPHWSPDGTRIAFMAKGAGNEPHWRIYLVSSSGTGVDEPLPDGDDQGVPTWTPDGRSIVFGDLTTNTRFEGAAIHELDLQTRDVATIPTPTGMWSPRMSPDGRHLAAVSYDSKSLYIRDNLRNKWRKCVSMNFVDEPSWPLDSSWVQFSSVPRPNARGLYRVSPNCEQPREIAELSSYRFVGAAWFGIGPDHAPLGLLRIPDEIYSLDWRLRRRIP